MTSRRRSIELLSRRLPARGASAMVASLLASFCCAGYAGAQGDDALPAAAAEITRAELAHHVRVLASDAMDGRGAATEGAARAARYLVSALEAAGLQPGASDGTFLQPLPAVIVEHTAIPKLILTTRAGKKEVGVWGRDFNVRFRGEARSTAELPIVRVTQENDLPDHSQPDKALFFRGTPANRVEWLARRDQGNGEGWGVDLRIGNETLGPELGLPETTVIFGTPPADECEIVTLRAKMRESLLWRGYTAVQLLVSEERRGVLEHNVVAILPGSDPDLAQEFVVLHAPYDHVGPAAPGSVGPRGDRVRNGANAAAGCAALLELAQSFAAAPPARTTVFLFTSVMSNARYGIEHFFEHPTVATDSIVAVLSLDRIGIADKQAPNRREELWLLGMGRSDFGAAVRAKGLSIGKAPYPDARMDTRGIALLARENGVIWHSLFCTPPDVKGSLWRDDARRIDYDHLLRVAKVARGVSELLVSGEATPAWRKQPTDSR